MLYNGSGSSEPASVIELNPTYPVGLVSPQSVIYMSGILLNSGCASLEVFQELWAWLVIWRSFVPRSLLSHVLIHIRLFMRTWLSNTRITKVYSANFVGVKASIAQGSFLKLFTRTLLQCVLPVGCSDLATSFKTRFWVTKYVFVTQYIVCCKKNRLWTLVPS